MAKNRPGFTPLQQLIAVVLAFGLLLIGGSAWLWWDKVYTSPANTFWGMVDNNLQTYGVSKHVWQSDGTDNSGLDEYSQLELGATNAVRVQTTITQGSQKKQSRVVTEAIGTPEANYQRYMSIDVPQTTRVKGQLGFDGVLGQWTKTEVTQDSTNTTGTFGETVFGAVPLGLLGSGQRASLIQEMKNDKMFTINFDEAQKTQLDGRNVYVYKVAINPQAYVTVLQKLDSLMGLNQLTQLHPEDYKNAPPINVEVIVSITSRQLKEVSYTSGQQRTEYYSAYGVQPAIDIPTQAVDPLAVQSRLQKILLSRQPAKSKK